MFFQKLADANQITFLDGADSWQEAVQLSCQSLVTNGAVDADYADQVIACVEKYGPYIVVVPGLAIPHCNEGNPSVHRSTIAYTKFRKEILFPFPEALPALPVPVQPVPLSDDIPEIILCPGCILQTGKRFCLYLPL